MYLTGVAQGPCNRRRHLAATVFGRTRSAHLDAEAAGPRRPVGCGLDTRPWRRSSGDRGGDPRRRTADDYHDVLFAGPWADAVAVPVNTRWSAREIAFSPRRTRIRRAGCRGRIPGHGGRTAVSWRRACRPTSMPASGPRPTGRTVSRTSSVHTIRSRTLRRGRRRPGRRSTTPAAPRGRPRG